MKRIALLGATGSIGRQALEVIAANPELELVAATSGSRPIDGLAPLTQTGGDPSELLERAEPDVVLNAVVGFAGLVPTMWALERGDHARPRQQGEPRRGRASSRSRRGLAGAASSSRSTASTRLSSSAPSSASPNRSSLPRAAVRSAASPPTRSARSPRTRRLLTRPGRWARRSRSTRRPLRTRASR